MDFFEQKIGQTRKKLATFKLVLDIIFEQMHSFEFHFHCNDSNIVFIPGYIKLYNNGHVVNIDIPAAVHHSKTECNPGLIENDY